MTPDRSSTTLAEPDSRGDALRTLLSCFASSHGGARSRHIRASIPIAGAPPASRRSAGRLVARLTQGHLGELGTGFPEVLRRIAENTGAVWKWAPPGTPVRACLVLAQGPVPKRKTSVTMHYRFDMSALAVMAAAFAYGALLVVCKTLRAALMRKRFPAGRPNDGLADERVR